MAALGLTETRIMSFGTPTISMRQGGEALVRLVEQWPDVEAAICVSDLSAFGRCRNVSGASGRFPRRSPLPDSVISRSRVAAIPITTVGVNCYEIGKRSGELLLRAIEGERTSKPIAAETIITPYAVIARDSA